MIDVYGTGLNGAFLIKGPVFTDSRGKFQETFQIDDYKKAGLPTVWEQENVSVSQMGVLRALHLQKKNPQGKLVRCLKGSVFDVLVDLRPASSTYLKHYSYTLRDNINEALYIPPMFAHGFLALKENSIFHYKCTTKWDKGSDGGIRYDDPTFGIKWPVMDYIISDKDKELPYFSSDIEWVLS